MYPAEILSDWEIFLRMYFVFLYAHIQPRDEGADREAVDFEPGNQYILRYRPISSLVHTGAAKLV